MLYNSKGWISLTQSMILNNKFYAGRCGEFLLIAHLPQKSIGYKVF